MVVDLQNVKLKLEALLMRVGPYRSLMQEAYQKYSLEALANYLGVPRSWVLGQVKRPELGRQRWEGRPLINFPLLDRKTESIPDSANRDDRNPEHIPVTSKVLDFPTKKELIRMKAEEERGG